MTKTCKRVDGKKPSKQRIDSKTLAVLGIFSVGCYLTVGNIPAYAGPVATNQSWNPGGAGGGPGAWDTTTPNWDSATTWTNGNNAIFGGSPGIVTIGGGGVSASGIVVNRGTYLINGNTLTLTGAGSIVANEDVRIDSLISGNVGLSKSGAGTLELNSANNYTGNTVISAGNVQNDINNALPTSTVLVVTGASSSFDLNGTLQHVAGVTLTNGGTINDLPSEGLLISDSDFDLQDGKVFAALCGKGTSLIKSGPGTVALYGSNIYGGSTIINGGTLIAGNDGVLPETTNVTVNGKRSVLDLNGYNQLVNSLTLSHGASIIDSAKGGSIDALEGFELQSGVVSASLGGETTVTKTTNGTVVLSGNNTYIGSTSIEEGTLIVNGSIQSDTTVFGKGTLGGSGVIHGNVINHGTVSPGNSPGTLTISGNYTQAASGTYFVQLASPSSYDRLVIGKRASLNGTLQVVTLNGFVPAPGESFNILSAAGGVTGHFSKLNTGTVLTINAIYEPNDVLLQLQQGSFVAAAASAARNFGGLTPNERSVAHALDRISNDPRERRLIDFLDNIPVAKLPHDFDLIAPEEYAALFDIGLSAANVQAVNLERRFEDIRAGVGNFSATGLNLHGTSQSICCPNSATIATHSGPCGKDSKDKVVVPAANPESDKLGFFITGDGEFVGVSSDGNGSGYDYTTAGTTVGLDYRLAPNFAVGVTAGYVHTWTDLIESGRITLDGGKGGVYASWFDGGFYLDGALTGGGNSYSAKRNGLLGTVTGTSSGAEFDSLLSGGYDMHHGKWTYGPTADLEYTYLSVNNFQESGSLAPLQVAGNDMNSLRSRLGFRASYTQEVGKFTITPEVRLAWQHEYLDQSGSIDAQFLSGAGGTFNVRGPVEGRDRFLVSAGVSVGVSKTVSVFAYYDGQLAGDNYSAQSVSGGLRVDF